MHIDVSKCNIQWIMFAVRCALFFLSLTDDLFRSGRKCANACVAHAIIFRYPYRRVSESFFVGSVCKMYTRENKQPHTDTLLSW